MTVHELHDALNLLPADLVAATDRLRTAPGTNVIPWKKILPMAACLALLILGTGWMVFNERMLSHMVMKETAAEAPAAMAPMQENQKAAADEILPELPSDIGATEVPAEEAAGRVGGMEQDLCIDHSHSFAEESDRTVNSSAYCGNMLTTVYLDGMDVILAGSDAVTITDILISLDYDPVQNCHCVAEFTVDTEWMVGIEVNLTQGFARCEKGQAALTQTQVKTIQEIMDTLN